MSLAGYLKIVLFTIWAVIKMMKFLLDAENDSENLSLNFTRPYLPSWLISIGYNHTDDL